ncbi:NACHT domain-containing protein [Micromonospora sagamiensis]|uniref:NACHT domain-containing protein n=1 Tax=Micromonospora sagamiensis TaxID=47875 RepID=UPI0016491FE0|nr:NACHT domain-containing protein [Micromonospora sagamiensis]
MIVEFMIFSRCPQRASHLRHDAQVIGWRSKIVLLGLAAGATSVATLAFVRGLEEASWLAAILALAVSGLQLLWRPRRLTEATVEQLDEARQYLADKALEYWRLEAAARGLLESPALTLRWVPASKRLVDRAAGATMDPGCGSCPAEFVTAYRQVSSGRLLVLGEQGGGKTGWVTLLVLGLLEARSQREPVPMLISLSSTRGAWRPTEDHLYVWLARRLTEEYPGLGNVNAYGLDAAKRLLTSGRVLPVLDGLDELSLELQKAAIAALNRQIPSTTPMVITCRTNAYKRLASTDVLQAVFAIRIEPLGIDDIVKFLTPRRAAGRWRPVLDAIADDRNGLLARALNTPLMASLARVVYSGTRSDPVELADSDRFPSRRAIEDHLLDAFVSAAFALGNMPRANRPSFLRWNPERAKKWSVFFACYLYRRNANELAWWEIWRVVSPGRLAFLAGAAQAVVAIPLWALLITKTDEHLYARPDAAASVVFSALQGGITIGLGARLMLGPPFDRGPKRLTRLWSPAQWIERLRGGPFAMTLAMGLGSAMLVGVQVGPFGGILAGSTGLMCGILTQGATEPAATSDATSPRSLLRADRAVALISALTVTVLSAVVALYGLGSFSALAVFVLTFPVFLVVDFLARSAWGPFLLVRVWLACRGKAPWRLFRFLEDAHRHGVLRQVGGFYQFRHSRLQERLASGECDSRIKETAAPRQGSATQQSLIRSRR